MPPLAPLHPRSALFLDFDGTLVPIAETPDAIAVPPGLATLLGRLHALLGGALAIVTGRQLQALDHFLAPLQLPAACEHGLERRNARGRWQQPVPQEPEDLEDLVATCSALAHLHGGLLVERKRGGVALHYRRAPELRALCLDTLALALQGRPHLELLPGRCVFEVKPAGVGKGQAIAAFLREPPFQGRQPVFVGDDVTDESGFATVQAQGGAAAKVGPEPSVAGHRLQDVQAVHDWLRTCCAHLAAQACPGAHA